jgi:hypothetical protein
MGFPGICLKGLRKDMKNMLGYWMVGPSFESRISRIRSRSANQSVATFLHKYI